MKNTLRKALAVFLSAVISISVININAFAAEGNTLPLVTGTESVSAGNSVNEEAPVNNWDGISTQSVYEGEGCRVTFLLTGCWNGGYNANITVENTSDSVMENWYLGFDSPNVIYDIWNAEIVGREDGKYVIKNAGWNQDIAAGGSISFGFSGNEDFKGFPTTYETGNPKREKNSSDFSIEYHLDSDWETGFTGAVTITNNTGALIEDWVLEFDFAREIISIWDAVMESGENNHYVIRNAGYNGNIAAGQSISFGFSGTGGSQKDEPLNYKISSYDLGDSGFGQTTFDKDNIDYSDDDKDGLPNFYEELCGLDKSNADTDGDGLPDGYEIFTLQTLPGLCDTNNNGIDDGAEDTDNDGLTNLQEFQYKTNPKCADTDGDSLTDYEEIFVYGSNPLLADTDNDGLNDNLEILYHMDFQNSDTLNDGIWDGDRIFDIEIEGEVSDSSFITPTLQISLKGSQIESLKMDKVEDEDSFLNSSIPGYLSNGYDLSMDGSFEEAELFFEIPDDMLQNKEIVPTVYYWNEETQLLEELEHQHIDGNRICSELSHFSKYILLDKNAYSKGAFICDILAPTDEEMLNQTFDVLFMLDESGSISDSNFTKMTEECAKLVDNLSDDDRIAVYTFDDLIREHTAFTDKVNAASELRRLFPWGRYTNIKGAVSTGIAKFQSESSDSASRIMILLTDGYSNFDTVSASYSQLAEEALNNGIVIYVVGVGRVDIFNLQILTNGTGGLYYGIDNFSSLNNVFDRIISDADLYRDSDNDGISDYHEKKIAAGELSTGTGAPIKFFARLSYLNPDSDGDGLLDGEELEIVKAADGSDTWYCRLMSNPCSMDTDFDGYDDYCEYYIGSPALSGNNDILAGAMGSNNSLPVNKWPDWQELIRGHAWNYIHNQVQKDARARHSLLGGKELVLPVGRADLYHKENFEIWEVKPASYQGGERLTKAKEQVKKYVACDPARYKIGGTYVTGNTFTTLDNQYEVTYKNVGDGVIVYFYKKLKKKPLPNVAVEEVKQPDEERKKYYNQFYAQPEYYFEADEGMTVLDIFMKIAAVSVVGSTLLEDGVTVGVGIWNDAPSFALAVYLWNYGKWEPEDTEEEETEQEKTEEDRKGDSDKYGSIV